MQLFVAGRTALQALRGSNQSRTWSQESQGAIAMATATFNAISNAL